ncbi:hypothetical protein PGR6_51530 [Pseudomonas sp. GR 6-02]|nr:hypothetical protein PGR6_51530 [Pseudomonas sp. GR 6-02]
MAHAISSSVSLELPAKSAWWEVLIINMTVTNSLICRHQ